MKIIIYIGIALIIITFILGIIGVIVERKRKGHGWTGQGFGR